MRDFDTQELAHQVNHAKRQLSKTPDASQEKNFNAILFNQSFSADLELVNAPNTQLPAFDEEPIAADPDLSEPNESDDERSLLENFAGGIGNQPSGSQAVKRSSQRDEEASFKK